MNLINVLNRTEREGIGLVSSYQCRCISEKREIVRWQGLERKKHRLSLSETGTFIGDEQR